MPDQTSPTRLGSVAALILLLAALAAFPYIADAIGQPALTPLASRILCYGIAAASLNLALGYGGMVSFGHAAFFGLGAYVAGVMAQAARADELAFGFLPASEQLIPVLIMAALLGGVLATAIGALSLRTSGVQFIMITLAFAQMLYFLFASLKAYGGDDGLTIRRRLALLDLDMRNDKVVYFLVLTVAVLIFIALWRIATSRFGRVLSGIRQNEARMMAIGIEPYRYKLTAFVLSGVGTAIGGALMANLLRFVSPDMLHWTKSGDLMIMVILGGVGTLLGPFFGAGALIALETVLAGWTENWQLYLGPLLLAVVLFTKGGLMGVLSLLRGRRA